MRAKTMSLGSGPNSGVLITGGGAGIGRATAEGVFGKAGAIVVVADVTDPQTARDVATQIESDYGGLDVLVNNVGTR